MKIIKAVTQREPPPRWGYLALMVGMLYLLRRAKIKDIPREVQLQNMIVLRRKLSCDDCNCCYCRTC
jgi:hypothetical protein